MAGPSDQLLQRLKDRGVDPLTREEISVIVADAVRGMKGDINANDVRLYAELESLAAYIQSAKREIADVQVGDINATHIPIATDELDAVVEATADATNNIMNACDKISTVAGEVGGAAGDSLNAIVTEIFEACNFQDITGQRITKVVRTLKHIEEQVTRLISAFGGQAAQKTSGDMSGAVSGTTSHTGSSAVSSGDEQGLLNGPQMPGNAINQDEIDKLLAEFDAPQK